MDVNALYKIPYGLYMLSSRVGNQRGGCIIDVCAQINTNPAMVVISVMNSNYTRELIDQSKQFTISILDSTCPLTLIQHFGMQSGRNMDKFQKINCPTDERKIPYLLEHSCATIVCDVYMATNLGTHTQYIGLVVDAWLQGNNLPMLYRDYEKIAYNR